MKKLLIPLLFTSYFGFAQLQKVEKKSIDGKIEETGYLYNDIRDSSWTSYYPDGTIKATAQYKMGVKVGVWTTYYENGQPMFVINYDEGKKKSGVEYSLTGEVVSTKQWICK